MRPHQTANASLIHPPIVGPNADCHAAAIKSARPVGIAKAAGAPTGELAEFMTEWAGADTASSFRRRAKWIRPRRVRDSTAFAGLDVVLRWTGD
jgi:hypothetical protein